MLGVAKKATLVVVEPGDANGNVYLDEIFGVWRWIVSDVLAKQRKGKAVVNFSNCKIYLDSTTAELILIVISNELIVSVGLYE